MDIANQRVVLTGAASGIGKALLDELLVYPGTQVVAADLRPEAIPASDRVHAVRADLSRQADVDELFRVALARFGGIDIFIANAGFAYYEKFDEVDWERLEALFRTNLISPIYSFAKMKRLNRGREYTFAVTASAMAMLAVPGYAVYAASKAAVHRFATGYRVEQDDLGHLLIAYPIATNTDFFRHAGQGVPKAWPVQEPTVVARAILQGIAQNQATVHTSALFASLLFVRRFLPFVPALYQKNELRKFKKWKKTQSDSSENGPT